MILERYILASDFLEKDDKYIFKARNVVVCKEILAFKYIFIVFSIIYICTLEILKIRVKNCFFGTQYPFVFVLEVRILNGYWTIEKWC